MAYQCHRITKHRIQVSPDPTQVFEPIHVFDEEVNYSDPFLPVLINRLRNKMSLAIDTVEVNNALTTQQLEAFEFTRRETSLGAAPPHNHTIRWEEGRTDQYEAHYRFYIRKLIYVQITQNELEACGITIRD
jgi:hypothetical protein